jgi:hypothetical protein
MHPGPSDERSDPEGDKGGHAQAAYIESGIGGRGGGHAASMRYRGLHVRISA